MAKRKHRGGSSDRHSPHPSSRPSHSESSSSGFRDGKAASGKKGSKPSRPPSRPGFGPGPRPSHPGKPAGKPRQGRPEHPSRSDWEPRPAPAAAKAPHRPESLAAKSLDRPSRSTGRNQLWLYGLHAVQAALGNPRRRRHRLLLTSEASEELRKDSSGINDLDAGPVEVTTREEIARVLAPGAVHQGAALLTEPLSDIALEDVLDQVAQAEKSVIVILDQVTDPQNVGAILRSAAAFGADAVVVPDRHAPPETGALVKAASGAVEMVPLVRVVNLARAMEQLKAAGFWCAGLDAQAPQTLAAADLSGKVALVLGAEGEGLRRLTRDHCDILARLPISARMESLNVSAAAAVALYELARKA